MDNSNVTSICLNLLKVCVVVQNWFSQNLCNLSIGRHYLSSLRSKWSTSNKETLWESDRWLVSHPFATWRCIKTHGKCCQHRTAATELRCSAPRKGSQGKWKGMPQRMDDKLNYCWWTKSCTTKDHDYPTIHRVEQPSQVVVWDFVHQQYDKLLWTNTVKLQRSWKIAATWGCQTFCAAMTCLKSRWPSNAT